MTLEEIMNKLNEDAVLSDDEISYLEDNFDQLDELSKDTLKNYIAKAGSSVVDLARKAGRKHGEVSDNSKLINRMDGINRAAHKLTKRGKYNKGLKEDFDLSQLTEEELVDLYNTIMEDEQLDELSKDTLKNYIAKATRNVAASGYKAGRTKQAVDSFVVNRLSGINTAANKLTKRGKYKKNVAEEIEDLDEISKATLGRYIKAASVDNVKNGIMMAGTNFRNKEAELEARKKGGRNFSNRLNGTKRAVDRLTKEDVMEAAIDTLKPGGAPGDSKSDMTAKLLAMTPMMSIEDLRSVLDGILSQYPEIAAKTADNSEANRKSVNMKEDVSAMFSGEELSEEFKTKASNLFESALVVRVAEEMSKYKKELDEANQVELEVMAESIEDYLSEMEDKLEAYTDYVAEQFIENNEVAIESALKNEINQDFIEGLKNLFAEHYIEVPDERLDVMEMLEDKVAELEEQLDILIVRNNDLEEAYESIEKNLVIEGLTEGLSVVDASRVKDIAESIKFEDTDSFIEKVEMIKERVTAKPAKPSNILSEEFIGEEVETAPISDEMKLYTNAIKRTTKI